MKNYFSPVRTMVGMGCLASVFVAGMITAVAGSITDEIENSPVFYQPLVWVGQTPPTDQESQLLAEKLTGIKAHGIGSGAAGLESFLANNPNSPWKPSVLINLGRYHYDHGHFTKAAECWEAAWQATKGASEGPAKQVADYAFAYWTKLLVGVGQVNQLRPLLEEAKDRSFDQLPLRVLVNGTRQEYKMMISGTDISFRCGSLALNDMLRAMKQPALDLSKVGKQASPVTGFSLSKLAELGQAAGAELVSACWGDAKLPVVPSVVHWRQDHYAAIIAEHNGLYQVMDLAIGKPIWLSAQDIQTEASGNFLIPKAKMPADWKLLSPAEAGAIYGRGYVNSSTDPGDGCKNQGSPSLPPNVSPGTPPNVSCGTCSKGGDQATTPQFQANAQPGMATWGVSEPYINVWLYDTPMTYQPGLGAHISFHLAYKQRDVETYGNPRTISPNIFSVGQNWNCSWITYIKDNDGGATATMFVDGGGVRNYTLDGTTKEYYSNTTMQRTTDANGILTGFILSYSDGAADNYQAIASEQLDGKAVAFISSKVDRFGHATQFIYQDTNDIMKLQYVIDPDGRTNTLYYTNVNASLITGIQDPFGNIVTLQYDSTGMLTNITDVVGIKSSFQYDSLGWVTNLTTPYGANQFIYFNDADDWTDPDFHDYTIVRGVTVIDPLGGTNIYVLRQDSTYVYTNETEIVNFLQYSYSTNGVQDDAAVPVYPGIPENSFVDNNYLYYRNSFHWGPRQALGLPGNLNTLAPADYIKARMKHWFHSSITGGIGQTLALEQEPSPDGQQCGQTTWYGYTGWSGNFVAITEGIQLNPALIARVLPDGTTWYTWNQMDDWGRATNVVDTYSTSYGAAPQARTNTFVYGGNNEADLIAHYGPQGELEEGYAYNANHQVIYFTNALNEVTAYAYDAQGRLTRTARPSGLVTTNIYYSSGAGKNFVQSTIDLQINRTNTYTYNNNLVYSHTDERGLTTVNLYDALNRLRRVSYPDGTYITNSYKWLDLISTKDRMGYLTSYGYDSLRHLVAVTNALNNYTLYNYCPCGSLESVQDAMGNFTYFTYDNAGNQLSVVYPDGYAVYKSYDLIGQVVNTVDSGGVSLTSWYNNQGLMYATSNLVGVVSYKAYDIENRPTNTIDANSVSVTASYDLLGRVLTRSYPDGGSESYSYTFGFSKPTRYTDQLSQVTLFGFDAANRKVVETNALNNTTRFSYNPGGDLLSLLDGNLNATAWGYDVYGRVTNKVDAANNLLFVYQYDSDNRLTNRWSAAKGNTRYAYDPLGNLTNVVYPVSLPIRLAYDKLNRLTNMVDAVGTSAFGYDPAGQLLYEDGPWANDTVNFSYQNRLRSQLSLPVVSGADWTENYAYDSIRRMTGVTSPAGSFGYVYDPVAALRVKRIGLPNGAYITNSYDGKARLTGTWLFNTAGTNLDSYVYTYDQGDQRTNVVRAAGDHVGYTYDDIGELATAIGRESAGTPVRLTERLYYSYDAAGNMLTKKLSPAVSFQVAYGLNNLNQIANSSLGYYNVLAGYLSAGTVSGATTMPATNVTINGTSAALYADNTFAATFSLTNGLNTFTAIAKDAYGRADTNISLVNVLMTNNAYRYDLNGNLLTDGTRGFAYDDENQLISVWKTNVWRNDFVYDGKMRRRITKDFRWDTGVANWVQTNEVHYVYDGNLVVQERDTNHTALVSYTRGTDLSGSLQGAGGIGGLLARTDHGGQAFKSWVALHGGTVSYPGNAYYHCDGNGNVTYLIDPSQQLAAKYLYDPYGNMLAMAGRLAEANTYRFSSKEWNANSGLYYYLYRFYDPNLQKWLNRDPLGEVGFEFIKHYSGQKHYLIGWQTAESYEGPNLYSFVRNFPVNAVDAKGELLVEIVGGILIVAIAAPYVFPYIFHHPHHGVPPTLPPHTTRPPANSCPASGQSPPDDPLDGRPSYPGNPLDPNNPNFPPRGGSDGSTSGESGDGPWSRDPDWWRNGGEGEGEGPVEAP